MSSSRSPRVKAFNEFVVTPGAALRDLHSEGFGAGGLATGCLLFGRAAADGLQPLGGAGWCWTGRGCWGQVFSTSASHQTWRFHWEIGKHSWEDIGAPTILR